MTGLSEVMLDIRKKQRVKERSPREAAAFWTSDDLLEGVPVKCYTIIFQTRGCYWGQKGGCTMCGYIYDSASIPPSTEDLIAQFDSVADRIGEGVVKIFTSGSFFDVREIPESVREHILTRLNEITDKVIIETRPEFVTDKTMVSSKALVDNMEVAIGLETSNDDIRINSINKNFLFKDFVRASETAKAHGVTTKAYLMMKPPFISEKDALDDMVKSVMDAAPYAPTISINLCNVQRGTLVDELFYRKAYRPPWLWSIVEVIKRVHGKTGSVIMSDPLAAGASRGPHNCGKCDSDFANAIRKYSMTQDISAFDDLDCECRSLWEKVLELEDWTFGAPLIY
ncbi:TIGR01210 family radical SAM protein [Methanocella sp. CWC-04]|uniref:TIGR01210 family radical SAM protein n=1 Tax=Methanooceanicella nereidis TaxID=2052831 RepID=A0AAP2RFG9_9EURY|nr:archaeosine biosynthesis radical SAM protein RaSEA [Methanocella sp. CWC-04]MCD1295625.1 TIGR01210 family radical SAM protein [Methanocella sp. CWC-04]